MIEPQQLGKLLKGMNSFKPACWGFKAMSTTCNSCSYLQYFFIFATLLPFFFYRDTRDEKVLTHGVISKFFETYLANAMLITLMRKELISSRHLSKSSLQEKSNLTMFIPSVVK